MNRILTLLAFALFSINCFAIDVKIASPSDFENEKIKVLHTAQEEFSLYMDEYDGFILNWPNELSSAEDSLIVSMDNEEFGFKSNQGVLVTGLKSNPEAKITIKATNAQTKETSSYSLGLKVFKSAPLFKHEAIVLGLLMVLLALVFYTNSLASWSGFYKFVPALLLCYFLPATLNSLNIINGQDSDLYYVASRFLLPASLVLLCLSIDLKGIFNLGPKALIMFFAATLGVVIGGPLALWIVGSFMPEALGGESANALWRGLSTVAGSWIGGGANQTAMKEIAECPEGLFSNMILVDVALANIWMAFLLFGTGMDKKINKFLRADNSAVDELKEKVESYQKKISRVPSLTDIMIICGIAFGAVAIAHFLKTPVGGFFKSSVKSMIDNGSSAAIYLTSFGSTFFWLIVFATAVGVALSFTKLRSYEGAGASKIGSLFIYVLVASIGMKINVNSFFEDSKIFSMLLIGAIWMIVHITILLLTAKIIKAPFFLVAVGSQANIGGAASAPVVASAFSPALAPVGVLLAVLGYAVGTIAAFICMEAMHFIS